MQTVDPTVLIALITSLTSCVGSIFVAALALFGVVGTAWINNRVGHGRHETTSKENKEILVETEKVSANLALQKIYTASRFNELQTELNECKNKLNDMDTILHLGKEE